MGRRGLSEKEQLLDVRAAQWAGIRAVVCDVETTGLNVVTSRVVSVAVSEIQAGRVLGGYASLVDPGLDRLGAYGIHYLTVGTLRTAAAPAFETVGPILLSRLAARDTETVLLAGYNVVFDALMLNAEYARLGSELPRILLLDAQALAARVSVAASSLSELASSLGLTPTDEHSAVSDAMVTAQALLLLGDRLRALAPEVRIDSLAVPFDPGMRLTRRGGVRAGRKQDVPLTPDHEAAHTKDLTTRRVREAALAVCVRYDCAQLVGRVEDSITTPHSAETVAEWFWGQLDRGDIPRGTRGRLLTALAVAVGRTDDPELIQAYFNALGPILDGWGPCAPGDQCDRCADPDSGRLCRYIAVRYALIAGYLTRDNALDEGRADAFLPYRDPSVRYAAGRPPTGWFGQLVRAGDLDAAGYGAQLAAQAGAASRKSGREIAMLRNTWGSGSRNAKLADQLCKRVLGTAATDGSRAHLDEALAVCDQAIATQGVATGRVWDSLHERRARILVRKCAKPRKEPKSTRNTRQPRTSRFVVSPPETTAPAPKPKARKRPAASAGR